MAITIDILHTGPLQVNTYIVSGGVPGECFIVDPADATRRVMPYLAEHGLTCTAVLLTHCHFDHILGVAALQEAGAKVYIGAGDAPGLQDRTFSLASPVYPVRPCQADVLLQDGDTIIAAGIPLEVLETPGHSKGGVCYVCQDAKAVFSGDTLFYESIGRYDFIGGDPVQLYRAIQDKLFTLPEGYAVLPGHGEATTLEHERRFNPYLQRSPAQW